MPGIYKKSIQLYYKPHDGENLTEGNACEVPSSIGPLTLWYGIGYTGTVSGNNYCAVSWGVPPSGTLGQGCVPYWYLEDLAAADIELYLDNGLSQAASPGKYSTNQFPTLVLDDGNYQAATVYSYKPPPTVVNHIPTFNWETINVIQPGNVGDPPSFVPTLVSKTCQPIEPVLVNFSGLNQGQVYSKDINVELCNPDNTTTLLENIRYFPISGLPSNPTLQDLANAGVPLYEETFDALNNMSYSVLQNVTVASKDFPNTQTDVNIYSVSSSNITGILSCSWEIDVCTQVVAPEGTVKSFPFVKYSSELTPTPTSESFINHSFCSTDQVYTIYYINDNVEYESVKDLMFAGEQIYITEDFLPPSVIPEYWELIHAPEGAYGASDVSFAYYLREELQNYVTQPYLPQIAFQGVGWYQVAIFPNIDDPTGEPYVSYSVVDSAPTDPYFCLIEDRNPDNIRTLYQVWVGDTVDEYCQLSSAGLNATTSQYEYYSPTGNILTLEEIAINGIVLYNKVDGERPSYYQDYSQVASAGYYGNLAGLYYGFDFMSYVFAGPLWKGRFDYAISESFTLPYICPGETRQITNVISTHPLWTLLHPDHDFSDEYCYRQKFENTGAYYYDFVEDLTLEQIAQYNIPLRTADALNSDLIPFAAYSDSFDYYYKWASNADGTGGNWIGLDSNQQESHMFIVSPIGCSVQSGPNYFNDITPTSNVLTQPNVTSGSRLAFYVFSSCIPINNQYLHYIVYGGHTQQTEAPGNWMVDFVEQIGGFNTTFYSFESTSLRSSCKTYVGKIYAQDPAEAISLMSTELPYFQGDIQYVSPIDIGLKSEGQIYYYDNTSYNCDSCLGDFLGSGIHSFPEFDDGSNNDSEIAKPRFNLEKNYKLHNKSKPLLRTNPRLTGNVKLIVDSRGEIYLESINANKDLSNSRYKRYGVSENGDYSYDVSRFFNDNKTPYEMVYETKRSASDLSVLESYDFQFEEDYQYGVRFNQSKLYDENFRLFAPIQIDTNIPKLFVIYRVSSPKPDSTYNDEAADKLNRINDILANSTIIHTFDLSEKSKIGKYIRNHVYNESFQDSQLVVSFEKNEQTFYKGIDLVKGGFTSKGEFIYKDFVATDKPLIEANDFITDGFKRNRVISSNILNLEFMFDDDQANEYTVNRYFGIFVDDIPSGKGKVTRANSGVITFKELTSYMFYDSFQNFNGTPITRQAKTRSSSLSTQAEEVIESLSGENVFDGTTFAIPSSNMMKNIPVLGYVKSSVNYHNIKNGQEWDTEAYDLVISNNKAPREDFIGIKDTNTTVNILENLGVGYDFIKLEISENPFPGDRIAILENKKQSYCIKVINHVPNTNVTLKLSLQQELSANVNSGNSAFSLLENIKNQLEVWMVQPNINVGIDDIAVDIEGEVLYVKEVNSRFSNMNLQVLPFDNFAQVVKVEENYTNEKITENILTATSTLSKGRCSNNSFSSQGSLKDVAVAISGAINKRDGLTSKVVDNSVYIYTPKNIGYARYQYVVLIDSENATSFITFFNVDLDNDLKISKHVTGIMNLSTQTSTKWTPLYLIGGHSDGRSALVLNNSIGDLKAGDYIDSKSKSGYNRIIDIVENIDDPSGDYSKLILNERHELGTGEFKVFREFETEIGLFSAYDIYDMNFDFYDTSNSDLKELKYETYQNIDYTPATEALRNAGTDLNSQIESLGNIISPDYIKSPEDFFAGLNPILYPENPEDQASSSISSEYDRLHENSLKEFAINSRVVPNINKWVMKDVKTVRDQPYYLNVNEAFGRTNFAPDIEVENNDPSAFTHEWFYIVNKPEYLKHYMLNETFSYINYISGFELTKDMFKSIDNDYFSNFMISEGFDVVVDPDEESSYKLTFAGDTLYVNNVSNYSFKLVVGETYYFNLNELESPELFQITGSLGDFQIEELGGITFGIFTPTQTGYEYFLYQGGIGGSISVALEDFNSFEAFVKTNRNIKYSISSGGGEKSFSSTVFKGLKFLFKNRKEFIKERPAEFLKDATFNDYKFSVLVDYKTKQDRNKIDYEVIKNDKFKFVILYITVYIDEIYLGNTLNRKMSYLLSNQFQSLDGETFVEDDVRISGALDLSSIDFNLPGPYIVTGIQHLDGSEPDFLTQLSPNNQNTYGELQIDYQVEDENGDPIIYSLQIIGVISNNQIIVEGAPYDTDGNLIDPVYLPISLQEFAVYTYIGGGINNHTLLLSNLTANNIAQLLNENNPSIKYTTITKEGEELSNRFVISVDDGKEIVRASRLIAQPDNNKPKSYSLFNGTIGYNLENRNEYYPFLIRHSGKYTCDLTPVITFTDIYSHFKVDRNYEENYFLDEKEFKNKYYRHPSSPTDEGPPQYGPKTVSRAKSYYMRYNRANVAFNLGFISDNGEHDSHWGMIKNHFYHKTNEDNSSGVTKLSESGESLPVYPLIGEIAIDRRDVNVFRSSWEEDYYRTSLVGGRSVSSPGTFSTKESRSYFASTVMKLRESYTLTSFSIQNAQTIEDLDRILKNNSHEANVVFAEDSEKVYIDFYMTDLISNVLSSSGIEFEIGRYVDAESSFQDKTDLSDDVNSYVNTNLVNLFSVDEVEIYALKTQNQPTSVNSVESLDLINNGGFKLDINYTIVQHTQRPINFRLIYNKSVGYSHIIRPVIKITQ